MIDREPGIYCDIPNEAYHGGPGVSKSGLDILSRSPMHFRFAQDAANDNAPTAAQRIGTAAHCLILEPKEFGSRYAAPFEPDPSALTTVDEMKEYLRELGAKVSGTRAELMDRLRELDPAVVFQDDLRAAHAAENAGREILSPDDMQTLAGMAAAVHSHPAASALLAAPGLVEASCYWRDPATDLLCRCRPDFWRDDGIIVDLKTTDDASPEGFARSIADWRYHVQVAMYLDGTATAVDQTFGRQDRPSRDFVFIAVEKKPPHAVAVYRLDDDDVHLGRELYLRDLKTLRACIDADTWPAYGDDVQRIGLPRWYRARMVEGL